ncbi:MAG: hypothetical protein QOH09_3993 [Pseudonocardiales bacterium]|jgi:hypothetical protein|nr:hypothetical protein [Pseudonocardiales bacterium]
MLRGSSAVPFRVVNTKSESVHRSPAPSRSAACCARCRRSARMHGWGSATLRVESPVLVSSCRSLPATRCSCIAIVTLPSTRSTPPNAVQVLHPGACRARWPPRRAHTAGVPGLRLGMLSPQPRSMSGIDVAGGGSASRSSRRCVSVLPRPPGASSAARSVPNTRPRFGRSRACEGASTTLASFTRRALGQDEGTEAGVITVSRFDHPATPPHLKVTPS